MTTGGERPDMRETLATLCSAAHGILSAYYEFSMAAPTFRDFLLEPSAELGNGGCVLLEEDTEASELFLGIRFGEGFMERLRLGVDAQILTVVAEETSHFLTLLEAAAHGARVSRLELETQGEIDRFLMLLHWNAHTGAPLSSLCDAVFTGPRFALGADTELYVEAEARAFGHLRTAFSHVWTAHGFDASRPDATAARYLEGVRRRMLGLRQAA